MCLNQNDILCIQTIDPIFQNCQSLLNITVNGGYKKLGANALNNIFNQMPNFNLGINSASPIFSGGFYDSNTDTVLFDFSKILTLIKSNKVNDLKIIILHEVRHSYQKHEIDLMKKGLLTHEPIGVVKQWSKDLGNKQICYSLSSTEQDAYNYSTTNYTNV